MPDALEAASLVARHEGFVFLMVRYCVRGINPGTADHADAVQIARLAMFEAALTFDPAAGAFLTWAGWRVRTSLAQFRQQLVRRGFRAAPDDVRVASLAAPLGGADDGTLADLVAVASDPDRELTIDLKELLSWLQPREREMIEAVYLHERTLADVAAQFAISRERVRQVVDRGFKRIRDRLALRA